MSSYATIYGQLYYESDAAMAAAEKYLAERRFAQNGFLLNELNKPHSTRQNFLASNRMLNIVPAIYARNLLGHLNLDGEVWKGATTGRIVWATTDGQYLAGIIAKTPESQINEEKNLIEWGSTQLPPPPGPTDSDKYIAWVNKLVTRFIQQHKNAA